MKKVLKTVLILLVVLIIVLGAVAYFNRNLISAFLMAYTASEDELQEKLDSSGVIVDNDVLSEYTDITLRDLTDEEKSKLASNELSEDDAVALVMGLLDPSLSKPEAEDAAITENDNNHEDVVADVPIEQIPVTETPSQEESSEEPSENVDTEKVSDVTEEPIVPEEPKNDGENKDEPALNGETESSAEISDETKRINQRIAELVAKLYVVKARVTSNLDTYIEELRAEILEIPTTAERKAAKPQFAARAIKVVAKWEKECDTEINALLSEIETILKDSGQSLELVNTIRTAYEEEKAAKKAYCINRYLD